MRDDVTAGRREIQYLVLPDAANPYLLARVRWPDICQAISPVRPDWQDDPGLFDLPYDPSSARVTLDEAAAIAAEWEAQLPSPTAVATFDRPLMRRMPSNWSNLSRAEKRAWSIEFIDPRKDRSARPAERTDDAPAASKRRFRRRAARVEEPVVDLVAAEASEHASDRVVDATGAQQVPTTGEGT